MRSLLLTLILASSFKSFAKGYPKIPIHFVVLSSSSDVHKFATSEQLDREIRILNDHFVKENGDKIFEFYRKSASFYTDIANSDCDLLKLGDQHKKPSPSDIKLFFQCEDRKLRDPGAINFYIFKSHYEGNALWKNSYAGTVMPWLMVNWERMVTRFKAAQEHEMGHIFGLGHTRACGSRSNTNTNIMATPDKSCDGEGGNRSLGFNSVQMQTIYQSWSVLKKDFVF